MSLVHKHNLRMFSLKQRPLERTLGPPLNKTRKGQQESQNGTLEPKKSRKNWEPWVKTKQNTTPEPYRPPPGAGFRVGHSCPRPLHAGARPLEADPEAVCPAPCGRRGAPTHSAVSVHVQRSYIRLCPWQPVLPSRVCAASPTQASAPLTPSYKNIILKFLILKIICIFIFQYELCWRSSSFW